MKPLVSESRPRQSKKFSLLLIFVSLCLQENLLQPRANAWCTPSPSWSVQSSVTPSTTLTPCSPSATISIIIDPGTNGACGISDGVVAWTAGGITWTLTDAGWVESGSDPYIGFSIGNDYTTGASLGFITRSDDAPDETVTVTASCIEIWEIYCSDIGTTWYENDFPESFSFHISNGDQVCPAGTCGGPPRAPGAPSGPSPIGTGRVENDRGPSISFPLGPFSYQQDAGVLSLSARTASTSFSSPAALYLSSAATMWSNTVSVTTNSDGVILTNVTSWPVLSVNVVSNNGSIRQIKSPQGLVNVTTISPNQYQLQMFYNSTVTPPTGGLYGTNASAFDVWTIDGSAGTNQLIVTETPAGGTSRSFTYIYTNIAGAGGWQLTDSGNLRSVLSWQVPSPTNTNLYSTFREILSGGNIVEMTQKTFTNIAGLPKLVQQIDGAGTVTNTTSYTYNGANLIQEIDYPNGNWLYRTYDTAFRVTAEYSPYGNTPSPASTGAPPDPTTCKMVTFDYSKVVSDDNAVAQPSVARTEAVYLPGAGSYSQVSLTYRSCPSGDEIEEWRCPNMTQNDPANLLTTTVRYSNPNDPNTFGQLNWQVLPDATATLYSYQEDTNGMVTNIIMQTGQPDNTVNPGTILEGSQTTTALNAWGQIISVTNQVITGGAPSTVVSAQKYTYTDALQLSSYVVDLAGRTNQYQYACCGLATAIDPDGVTTVYDYDTLKRQVAATTLRAGTSGVKLTNILDAAGRVLASQRIGTDLSVMTLVQSQYDILSRVVRETNALGGVTTHTNVMTGNRSCVTNIYPDLGTRVEVYYADGRLQSISGTAVAPVQYAYGIETDTDGSWREFTLETRPDANDGTSEWTKTYTDGARRQYKTIYAGASSNPFSISYYNSLGQVTNQVDPDGVSTLYAYNGKGEQVLTVVDMNRDYNIDFSGPDRITLTTNDVVADHGANVRRTQLFAWGTNGSASSNVLSTTEISTDDLQTWSTVWNNGVAATAHSTTVYAAGGNRYQTNTAPDGSFSVSAYQYGKLASTTSYDSTGAQIVKTSFGYDTHWRQNTATDARNGTTTTYFNHADQVSSTITPPPASGQAGQVTTNFFDGVGRIIATRLPDNTSVTNVFYPTGQGQLTFGSRQYPVAYSYDTQGRMKTMTNWSSVATQTGARVTTWNYDPYRGFLTNKTYDGNAAGPTYTYTDAGRLASRLWARGLTTTYSYNDAGDLAAVTYDDGVTPTVSYGYDRRGRQSAATNGPSACVLALNDIGQTLSESWYGGPLDGLVLTNGYDQFTRRTNLWAQQSNNSLIQQSFDWDPASRLQSVSDGTNSAAYTYLANSPLVGQINFATNGTVVMSTVKQYDSLNRLTSIASLTNSAPVASFAYAYNSANQRTAVTNVDNSYWLYTYDALGQVTSGRKYWADGTPVAGQQFVYAFDDIGNRQSAGNGGNQFGGNLRYQNYSANTLNQYTQRTVPGYLELVGTANSNATVSLWGSGGLLSPSSRKGEYFWAELPVNNTTGAVWLSVTNLAVLNNGSSPDFETNIAGSEFLPASPEAYGYDLDGNLTNDGRWSYTWDAENRLVKMAARVPTGPQISLQFDYDWQGRRIRKQVWGNTTWYGTSTNDLRFVYDRWDLLTELSGSSPLRTYIRGLDLSGSVQGAGAVGGLLEVTYFGALTTNCFPAFDGNGDVAALVNAGDGTSLAHYEYGPFGEVTRATDPAAKAGPFRFSTKYQDDETDLLYYGYRYYNASMGRWCNRDPLEEAGGLNMYSAFNNSSPNNEDERGEFPYLLVCPCARDITCVVHCHAANPFVIFTSRTTPIGTWWHGVWTWDCDDSCGGSHQETTTQSWIVVRGKKIPKPRIPPDDYEYRYKKCPDNRA
jgi:RHS repeat-associated protein